jgi:hypothetical protein
MDMCKVFCCNPVVRNGNKETTDALIRAMRDEALKRGLVRDELIGFCNRFLREGEIKACIEH